ncbi:MAG: hypothetical protein WAO16_08825 [Pseudolabrys sp.]
MSLNSFLMSSGDKNWRIGIDFDNTIVGYDKVFLIAARERQLVGEHFVGDKRAIRDAVRLLPDGELKWQRLQGYVYGSGISDAVMFDGLDRFLRRCRSDGHTVMIVSHKTEFGHFDANQVKLRQAAHSWMTARGFFQEDGYGIFSKHIFFESTRAEKLKRIADLACTHFIDDLEEVLSDPSFPPTVARILFAERAVATGDLPYIVCPSWRHIEEVVFGEHS